MTDHEHQWVPESGRSTREVCLRCGLTRQPTAPTQRTVPAPDPRPTQGRTQATDRLVLALVVGVLLAGVGTLLAWFGLTPDGDDSTALVVLGALTGLTGYVLLGVGAVGFGVKLGVAAAAEDRD